MSTYGPLTGTGTQALSAGTGALHVHINALALAVGSGEAFPTNFYHQGFIRAGDGTAWWNPIPIEATDAWIPIPNGSTQFSWSVLPNGSITVTEVIGTNPFQGPAGPTGATGPAGPAGSPGANPTVLLDHIYAANLTTSIPGTSTWTDILNSTQTFAVTNAGALVEIAVQIIMQVDRTTSGAVLGATAANVDGTRYVLGHAYGPTDGRATMGLTPVKVTGLSAASHTFKLQALGTVAYTWGCNPTAAGAVHMCRVQVTQFG